MLIEQRFLDQLKFFYWSLA